MYAHRRSEVSSHFLRQQAAFVLDEFLDLLFPRSGVSGFPVSIFRGFVPPIEVVTQVRAGVDARLDQLSPVLVYPSGLS